MGQHAGLPGGHGPAQRRHHALREVVGLDVIAVDQRHERDLQAEMAADHAAYQPLMPEMA